MEKLTTMSIVFVVLFVVVCIDAKQQGESVSRQVVAGTIRSGALKMGPPGNGMPGGGMPGGGMPGGGGGGMHDKNCTGGGGGGGGMHQNCSCHPGEPGNGGDGGGDDNNGDNEDDSNDDLEWWPIVLGVVGGVALLVTAIVVYLYVRNRADKRRKNETAGDHKQPAAELKSVVVRPTTEKTLDGEYPPVYDGPQPQKHSIDVDAVDVKPPPYDVQSQFGPV
jgi:hypothetical protein